MDSQLKDHAPKYPFNRRMFDETKYANNYVTSFHTSPFVSRKPTIDAAKK